MPEDEPHIHLRSKSTVCYEAFTGHGGIVSTDTTLTANPMVQPLNKRFVHAPHLTAQQRYVDIIASDELDINVMKPRSLSDV